MKISVSDKYILLTEMATAIVNQANALVASYPTAVKIPVSQDSNQGQQAHPLDGIAQAVHDALQDLIESLAKGLYRNNCISVLTEDVEKVYTTLQQFQSKASEYETENWFSKFIVNLVCGVGAYKPILEEGLQCLNCRHH